MRVMQRPIKLLGLSVGLGGVLYFIWRWHRSRKWWQEIHFRAPKLDEIINVKSLLDCEQYASEILSEIETSGVVFMGFDCEWVGKNKTALIQISIFSTTGLRCYLFRICKFDIEECSNLMKILKSKKIIKLGVGIDGDMKRLANETSDPEILAGAFFDLRFLAFYSDQFEHGGLASLVRQVLNRKLDKDWRIRASNWEAEQLTNKQKLYAADDSVSALQVMAKFYHFMSDEEIETIVENNSDKDFKHKQKSNKSNQKPSDKPITDKKKRREEKVRKRLENETFDSHIKSYSVRKAPLYNNTRLEAPDGVLLTMCDRKKAQWYAYKGLGRIIEDSDDAFIVRLNFEPAGRPNSNSEKYYTTEKNNECVVCGSTKSLIRKNVVPREYRKHFPTVMKCHVSHDIVLLCLKCHARSNEIDYLKRAELADEFQAPIGNSQRITANLEDRSRKAARSAGNALLRNYDQIPIERRNELEKVLLNYFGGETFDMSLVKKGADLPVTVPRDDGEDDEFLQHGNKVVSTLAERDGINSLKDFEVSWRKHFLDQMKPKFMPEGWDLYHNHERIEEKTQRELDRAQAEIDEVIEYVNIEDFPVVHQIPDGPGLSIHRGSLVDIKADALVISTNETMSHRGGISGAVMRRGGAEYEDSLGPIRKETRLRRSTCAYVPGVGKLKCKYVFLTCPSRRDRPTNPDKLDQVYRNVISKAYELGVKTIAFCAIGTGGKGLNQHDAAKCAVETVLECGKSFDKVCFNVFTDISEHAYRNKLNDLTIHSELEKPIVSETVPVTV